MKSNIFTIMKKELRRVFFDRKLAFTVFVMPGLTIAIIYSLMGGMIEKMGSDTSEHIAVIKTINAPVEFIEAQKTLFPENMNLIETEESFAGEVRQEIRDGSTDALVVFEKDFSAQEGKIPGIEVYISTVSDFSVRAGYMIDGLLEAMRTEVLAMRLGGIENTIVFNLNQNDVAEASEKAGSALGTILPMLLTVFLFAGAMQVGMDIIAGEKERGTLSTVLLTPVKRRDIALGKMFSLSIISLASCISSLIGVILSLPFSNSVFGGGFRISDLDYGVPELLSLILQMIFLAISFVSIICLMSSLARNIKEAGGFIAPTYMAIMVISISTILGIPEGNWVYLVPMYGNIISIKSILTLQYDAMNGLLAVASTLLFALIMAMLMVRTFNSERMMKSA